MKRNIILVPAVSLVLAGGAAFSAQALSGPTPPQQPDPRPTATQPAPPQVQSQPLPRYIKTLCNNGNRLYINRETGDLAVAAQDPSCRVVVPTPPAPPTSTPPAPPTTQPTVTQTSAAPKPPVTTATSTSTASASATPSKSPGRVITDDHGHTFTLPAGPPHR